MTCLMRGRDYPSKLDIARKSGGGEVAAGFGRDPIITFLRAALMQTT
jgi:hypothetical protein